MQFEHRYKNPSISEFAELTRIFTAVTDAGVEITNLPLLNAKPLDHDQPPVGRLYNALAVEFVADVEKATRTALSKAGALQPELWNAFVAIVAKEFIAPALRREVITRCSRIYKARKLHPNDYFRRYRNHSAQSIGRAA